MRLSTRIFCAVEGFNIFSLPEGQGDLMSTFDVSRNGHPVNQVVVGTPTKRSEMVHDCGLDRKDEPVGK